MFQSEQDGLWEAGKGTGQEVCPHIERTAGLYPTWAAWTDEGYTQEAGSAWRTTPIRIQFWVLLQYTTTQMTSEPVFLFFLSVCLSFFCKQGKFNKIKNLYLSSRNIYAFLMHSWWSLKSGVNTTFAICNSCIIHIYRFVMSAATLAHVSIKTVGHAYVSTEL